ncbi:MAG TPA: hypothetical protein VLK66_16340 [Longimicrobium sp.]|nr:hypothetical protein [Longimicrobium sp.]
MNPDDLRVESFSTTGDAASISQPIGGCCTGCVSGCGYNPTGGGCESASGQIYCQADPVLA